MHDDEQETDALRELRALLRAELVDDTEAELVLEALRRYVALIVSLDKDAP
jgi:hypothetical protein